MKLRLINSIAAQGNLMVGVVVVVAMLGRPTFVGAGVPVDCNGNGQEDFCDLSCANAGCTGVPQCGTSNDCNTNNIPDECESFPFTAITSIRVANGLSAPVSCGAPRGDSRLWIVEQGGSIKILSGGVVLGTDYLDIGGLVSGGSEQGLLGLAFDPNFSSNARFYVNYTNTSGNMTVVARYTASGGNPAANTADPASAVILKTFAQPESNHNGGCLQFGKDGKLYVSSGDGGGGNDQHGANGNGQNTGTLLGKFLRLDVNNPPTYVPADNPFVGAGNPLDEIWSIGWRNPWRFSFDRLKGDMYVGDVGQDAEEEIDFEPVATGGRNYGWRCMEGNACTGLSGCTCNAGSLTLPILDVSHSTGSCAIIGGYVYRGCAIPDLQGTYFFSDNCGNYINSFRYTPLSGLTEFADRTAELTPDVGAIDGVASFGEDGFGELYYCSLGTGAVYKIVPSNAVCGNGNIEPGEQCDDNNTNNGDGCSSTCHIESSDACSNGIAVGDGAFQFSTIGTVTDGPTPVSCGGGTTASNDVWFNYTAPCTGTATMTTCNTANYDSVIVVYNSCACPATNGNQIGCNDDTPGCGTSSVVSVSVGQGGCYKVRVGGFAASDEGTGTLTISCSGTACGNSTVEAGEQCDDGNTNSGDGCSATCQAESGCCACVTAADCRNSACSLDNACNCAQCVSNCCSYVCAKFGNTDCDGAQHVDLDDILCTLEGFAMFSDCPAGDISPCGGNGVINIDDILGDLNGFAGQNPCGCQSGGTPPLCGSTSP